MAVPFTVQRRNDDRTVQLAPAPLGNGIYRLSLNPSALTDRAGNATTITGADGTATLEHTYWIVA